MEVIFLSIGEKIKQFRKERNITQKDLGNMIGTTQQMIAQYENGRRNPKFETIKKIAFALNVLVSEIVDDNWDLFSEKELNYASAKVESITVDGIKFTNLNDYRKYMQKMFTRKNIVLDEDIDETQPINIILKKMQAGEPLYPEESCIVKEHIENSINIMQQTLKNFSDALIQSFFSYYALLNDAGQQKADLQIKKIVEKAEIQIREEAKNQLELISQIPEYQKEPQK